MHTYSKAMMLSPQFRATRPLLVSSPEGPSGGQKIISSTSPHKSSGTGKLKHIRKAMKSIKPARHSLLDDNEDEEEFKILAYSSQDAPKEQELSFSDLMRKELLIEGSTISTSTNTTVIPLNQPSTSAKAFKDRLEQQDSLTETRVDIDEGDEMSFSDLQPKRLVLDQDAAPTTGQTSPLRATLPSTLLREPSMASTQFLERMEALEAKSKILMDDDSHNSDKEEGFVSGAAPLAHKTLETPPRSGESFSLEGEDSLPALTHVPEPYFSTPEPYASAEEDWPTTKDAIAVPAEADLAIEVLLPHSDELAVAKPEQNMPKKHFSRNRAAASRDTNPTQKALPPRSRTADSISKKSVGDTATTTWTRPAASSNVQRKEDGNDNDIDSENHGAQKDKAMKTSSKVETNGATVQRPGRNSCRSHRTVDKKVRSSRRSKDSSMHDSGSKLGSPSSSSHLPRRSTSSQKEGGSDRKRHSRRSSTKDSTIKSSSRKEGSSRPTSRQRSRDSSMPPGTRSRDKSSRTRSRDSSLPARPRSRDELSRRSKRDSSLPPQTRIKDNGAIPPRSKSRDSSLPPRVRSLDDPMKSGIRHSESRRMRTRKVGSEDKDISASHRKHRSTRRSSALDYSGGKKSSRRHSQRPRRRRSSVTSGAVSDNSTHKKEAASNATKQKESTDKKEATNCDDGPVESMQLVLDATGTQIICEPTIFSSTHTASTTTTAQTTTPHSTGSIRTSTKKRTLGGALPTISTSSTNSGHRRSTPVTTRMRNSLTAQRLANSRKGKERSTKKPTKALTPLELLHESCVF